MSTKKEKKGANERIQHASWAGLIALIMSFLTLFDVVDQLTWVTQSRSANFQASGDIVYVGSEVDLADPSYPSRRLELARTLDELREQGAERVYLDVVIERPSIEDIDVELNSALRAFDGNAFLVGNYSTAIDGTDRFEHTTDEVSEGVDEVVSDLWKGYLGYTWASPFSVVQDDVVLPSLPASLAQVSSGTDARFPINYSFELASIPSYRIQNVSRANAGEFSGKTVVIGNLDRGDGVAPDIPGYPEVASSLVSIYAAETLKAGHTQIISDMTVLLTVLAILCLLGMSTIRRVRYATYSVLVLSLPIAVYVTAQLGVKISIGSALALLLIYAGFRARAVWKSGFRLVDADTNLPSFAALEAHKETSETAPTIIVAKIHRFEEVRRTLPAELHTEYLIRIIDRLKAAKKDTTIYVGQGHLIAWTFPEKEPALIKEHLEGLRALFASPLMVGGSPVDVGITFGVDITPSPNVTRRVAAAVSAAERTTETYEPIEIAEVASDEDLIWSISLQARIDAALSNGEIYLIYQPKILVQTGELVGVEALVRWRDPVKGLIPPDHFIRQCENAGRMDHLTRHVLKEACEAGNLLEDKGIKIPVAVNISATLVHEQYVVKMVQEVLEETGFDPHCLTLEITETYRISNFERAEQILGDLAALGPKISMDDFGVGAASLEALMRLPFSELKIDRLFTSGIKDDAKAAGIVRNILNLGKDLRIIVVAEGVEDESTLTILRDSGCLVAQGFGISRPVPLNEIVEFQRVKPYDQLKQMV